MGRTIWYAEEKKEDEKKKKLRNKTKEGKSCKKLRRPHRESNSGHGNQNPVCCQLHHGAATACREKFKYLNNFVKYYPSCSEYSFFSCLTPLFSDLLSFIDSFPFDSILHFIEDPPCSVPFSEDLRSFFSSFFVFLRLPYPPSFPCTFASLLPSLLTSSLVVWNGVEGDKLHR